MAMLGLTIITLIISLVFGILFYVLGKKKDNKTLKVLGIIFLTILGLLIIYSLVLVIIFGIGMSGW